MAFTSWSDLKTSILDAIADHIAGAPCVGEYRIGTRRLTYRSIDELEKLLDLADKQISKDSGVRQSFGRFRRFQ